MDEYDDNDDIGIRLKDSLDINDLRDPSGKGAEFEVDENDLQKGEREEGTEIIKEFDKNRVASNICWMSDNEDDEDENTDTEYLTDLEKLQRKMESIEDSDITPNKDKGVLKQLKSRGVGPLISPGSLVCIHYNAYTNVGEAPIDSSKLRESPEKIRLGKGKCIIGLELALLTMRKQETARFLIHPQYAYGEMGCPPRIPPKATMIYDVEVLYFVDQDGVDDYFTLTPAERKEKLKYADIEKVAKAEMSEGREYFERKNHVSAKRKYNKAIRILEDYHLKNDEEERLCNIQLLRANVNAAICEWNLAQYGRTISHCNQALQIDRNHVKALYFKGKALHSLSSFEDAKDCLLKARSLKPSDTTISKALQQLAKSMQQYDQLNRDFCRKIFSQPTGDGADQSHSKQPTSKEQEQEEQFGKCSAEFKAKVRDRLKDFLADDDMSEMPFPQIQMSEAEINCILETAKSLGGLDVRQRGTGNATRYEVYKKRK